MRTIHIPLTFLSEGNYSADLYSDAPDVVENPNHLTKEIKTINKADIITIQLAARGQTGNVVGKAVIF